MSVNYFDASRSCDRSVGTGDVVSGKRLGEMVGDWNEYRTRTIENGGDGEKGLYRPG